MTTASRSSFEIVRGPGFNAELKRLGATEDRIKQVVRDELITAAENIRNHIIGSMQKSPKITRTKNSGNSNALNPSGNFNWMVGGKLHIPSSPGYAPRPVHGGTGMISSIKKDVRQNEVEVGSRLKGKKGQYPKYLEEGTKNMEARPWLEPAVKYGERLFFTGIRKHILNAMR